MLNNSREDNPHNCAIVQAQNKKIKTLETLLLDLTNEILRLKRKLSKMEADNAWMD